MVVTGHEAKAPLNGTTDERKRRGAWYTPEFLVADVVAAALRGWQPATSSFPIRVVDPACGDGRFLVRVASDLAERGWFDNAVELVGVDSDPSAVRAARRALDGVAARSEVICADALDMDWSELARFDIVVGNPPFLSQLAASTARGGASARGGGPYADAAVEFLALAAEIVRPRGGRVGLVLPQSVLSARDAGDIRDSFDAHAQLRWSWWTGERVFDAQVLTCALVFEFGQPAAVPGQWGRVVTDRSGVPDVPSGLAVNGSLGDRCRLNANFRDEYYGLVPAVGDHRVGPKFVTSGLIDPGRCWWGRRPVTFAKSRYVAPRVDLAALDERMTRWAADRLVPKVLIANQTRIIEAVADPDGTMLPGVPVVAAYPATGTSGLSDTTASGVAWEIAAVLTSPVASAWAWHRVAGTGLSAASIRLGPVVLGELPWPTGDLNAAVAALRRGDVRTCAVAVDHAFGVESGAALRDWWLEGLVRVEQRQPVGDQRHTPDDVGRDG